MSPRSNSPEAEKQAAPLGRLTTEEGNPKSAEIDSMSALEIVRLMNSEDAQVAQAVAAQSEAIAAAIERIVDKLRNGGRLIYIGAGTSGRLGVLDASECPPTFNTPPEMIVGLIAGGSAALTRAIEGAEDDRLQAEKDLNAIGLTSADIVVGIATSGRTPYVIGGLVYSRSLGVPTIGFSCNAHSELKDHCDLNIAIVVGPEVISGSTRLKAGTATKMVLNMLTTGTMVRLGKTFGNLMVDLRATNNKLADRSRRIVAQLADVDAAEADRLLTLCGGEVKTAIVAKRRSATPDEARQLISAAAGQLRGALKVSIEGLK